MAGKRELVRLVRTAEGTVEIDESGRRSGRGAYLCPTRQCLETALKGGRLEQALRTGLDGAVRQQLLIDGERYFIGSES
jgi:predicted RNA-binding protein YlxR (DUF448 family)